MTRSGPVDPERLIGIRQALNTALADLVFAPPVAVVYNPLCYAGALHDAYLRRYGCTTGRNLLLGMNPGPWGMAQTGVPFGDAGCVREFLGLQGTVGQPPVVHPKRPVQGLDCPRGEVSGQRLWGWAQARFGTAEAFFQRFFVSNYCPLAFMEASGRNRTPDKLPAQEREPVFAACDQALRSLVEVLEPERVIGIGAFAEQRASEALAGMAVDIGRILHPSPASPAANRGWANAADTGLQAIGIDLPD